ncbi:MAG: NADP-dependent methylenetetrahydromethanopterin/methylenetetrahydrofolate dehydrogenase [Pirellulaceae bacterium]|nr:bifunctional NADP-dependent methylenetetrahydromethanopterin dehydrogenase/methylenetetrahydrofolate dehydrogenase [Planctomycetales bacterium]
MAQPKTRILLQLDSDTQASSFDAVVAIDAGVEQLLQHSNVRPDEVMGLVHGLIFTRGPADLQHSAVFVGGSSVVAGEEIFGRIKKAFFGPLRVSMMFDANGSNTTAAAAVVAAARHVNLAGSTSTVLAGTGPVGQRIARMIVAAGGTAKVASRSLERASTVCRAIAETLQPQNQNDTTESHRLIPVEASDAHSTAEAVSGSELVFAAGAAGVCLLPQTVWNAAESLRVAIDLNAVPPLGIEGVDYLDKGAERQHLVAYGAVGVGGTKMRVHTEAIRRLFSRNDLVLDADEIFSLARELEVQRSGSG